MSLKADRLYAANAEYIANVVWKQLHGLESLPMADKKDYAQIAYGKIYEALDRLDADRGSPHTYVGAVARNAIRDCLRRRRRRAAREAECADIDLRPSTPLGEAECIEDVLAAMPSRLRAAVEAVLDMGRTRAAQALGLTRRELADRLESARAWLRQSMRDRSQSLRGQGGGEG